MATTQVSNALIPYDPNLTRAVAKPEETNRARGSALIRASLLNHAPGRTLGEVYTFVGKAMEKQANSVAHRLGLGPISLIRESATTFHPDPYKGRARGCIEPGFLI
jgi:hypothetical protein